MSAHSATSADTVRTRQDTDSADTSGHRSLLTGADLLTGSLIHHHGLTPEEAAQAVLQRRRGETGPHAHLVDAEAAALLKQAQALMQAVIKAFEPLARAGMNSMAELARAVQSAAQDTGEAPTVRPNRPAWASPYGPPPRRTR
ncbi:hypothetical protein [Streptomyces sp. NPDC059063]|uniref:hypothetical protein n=1 Tax=Streptomyces sp. NPDC059063 TaxID=3346712 RepID=UPI00368CEB7C